MRIVLLSCVLLIFACGEVGMEIKGDEQELYQNYLLLKAYFYHPERINDYEKYRGMEVDSMYSSLNDYLRGHRYTRYFEPTKANDVLDYLQNSEHYYSFGFERVLAGDSDTLVVTAVYPNSPAAHGGLKKRDKLLFANEAPLTGEEAKRYEKTDSLFHSNTVFRVLRGNNILTLQTMQKEVVLSSTVFLDTLYGEVPLITVTEFTTNTNNPSGTYQEFKEVLQEIKGAKSAIIDLRGNPGGSVSHCTKMAAELSPPNREMIYDILHYPHRGKNIIDTVHYFAKDLLKSGDGVGIKWVIMIDGFSASCAERFAAALKSSRPETIFVGQTTYGKGIGQNYIKTYLGGLAGITSLQSYYPNGETFHEIGVEPTIFANPNSDEIYSVAYDAAHSFEVGLAKRSTSLGTGTLPSRHASGKTDLGAYELLH